MIRRVLSLLEMLKRDIENGARKDVLLSTIELIKEELLKGNR